MTIPERPHRRTGWTILIVPPNPLRSTRSLYVRHRHVRAVLAALCLGAFTVLGLGAMVASDSLDTSAAEEDLEGANRVIATLTDSLRMLDGGGGAIVQAGSPADASPGVPRARPIASRAPLARVVLPVNGIITSRFTRARFHPLLRIFRPHKGVDVSAPKGTPILAPASGRVVFAGRSLGNGWMIELDHGGGVHSRYAHCSVIKVREGDFVSSGDVIGLVGSTGLSTGPHLHFEVRVNGTAVDPLRNPIVPRLVPTVAAPGVQSASRPLSKPTVDPDGGSGDEGFPEPAAKDTATARKHGDAKAGDSTSAPAATRATTGAASSAAAATSTSTAPAAVAPPTPSPAPTSGR